MKLHVTVKGRERKLRLATFPGEISAEDARSELVLHDLKPVGHEELEAVRVKYYNSGRKVGRPIVALDDVHHDGYTWVGCLATKVSERLKNSTAIHYFWAGRTWLPICTFLVESR